MAEFNMDQFEQDYRNERRKALRDSVESGETRLPVGILQHGANRIGEGVSDTVQGIGAFAKSLYNNPQAVAEAGAEGLEALYNRVAQGDPMAAMEVAGMVATGGATAAIAKGARLADFATFDPNTSRMFIGDIGAKNLADAGKPVAQKVLQVARQMKMMGATETEIRAKTNQIIEKEDPSLGGVSFNSEGRLVVEIDDSKMAVRSDSAINRATGGYQTPAGGMYFSTDIDNVLKGTPLGKAYPNEINMKVSDVSEAPRKNVLGSFDENTNTITSFALKTDVPGVTAHELQHFIQAREGFPRGGNEIDALDGMYGNMANDYDEISTLLRQFNGKPIPDNVYQQFENPEIMRASLSKIRRDHEGDDDAAADFAENQAITIRDDPEDWAKTIYSYLAGEVEARNVQTRLKMTPAERRATPPRETETDARFKMPLAREDQIISKRAQGGEVMRGIGTLNETARNMFRGPSGIAAYQQLANGGLVSDDLDRLNNLFENAPKSNFNLPEQEFNFDNNENSEAEQQRLESTYGNVPTFEQIELPVSGKVQYNKDRDGKQRFDAEIAKRFESELGSITPSARYSTQRQSRVNGDVVVDDKNRQIGARVGVDYFIKPGSADKFRAAIDVENSRNNKTITSSAGELVSTDNGEFVKFTLGGDFENFNFDATYTDGSQEGTRAEGSATLKVGDFGMLRVNDSSDGPPSFSAQYGNFPVGKEGMGNLNYSVDPRSIPSYGAELNTALGDGQGSLSLSNDGRESRLGAKYNIKFAQGGEVMQGIGTLNETARNMTRGPRGIGAYQQFAIGGQVRGDQFNSQGFGEPLNMPYGPGQMSPYQQPQFGMGGMQQGNGINQYGQYLEQTYGDPEFDQKRDTFLQDVQQQEQQTFGGMDGEQHFGKAMVANPPQDYGFLGSINPLDLYKREQEQRESMKVAQIAQYEDMGSLANTGPALSLFASGGEAMGPPPTRGPDPQGIGYFQKFADGGPVYMQEGGPPSAGEIKSEILDAVYEAESNSNYDQWHLNAKNVPEKPLTEMTVEEIMRYQGNNKGPAAGAGQIKFDTLQYLIDYGTIQPTDVFTVETQDKAHSRLLDRRGFQSWVSGEMSNTDFGQNVAKEYAGIPLLADEEVNGVLRTRGSSRYGGSNVARIGLDDWEGLLATAKTATPDYGTVAAVNSEAKSPFIETLTMRGEDVAMSMPVEQSERMSELGQENLADGRYFQGTKPEDVMTPSVGELLSSKYSRPRTQEAAEAKQRAMDRSKQTSLYEQFAPEGVQDLFSGIGSYIRGEEPQQEEEVNVYGSPPAKPPETFRKFLKPNSTIL